MLAFKYLQLIKDRKKSCRDRFQYFNTVLGGERTKGLCN